ncbi:MAG: hypothetical protein ACKOX3_04990 [Bacteroidota bacterium]
MKKKIAVVDCGTNTFNLLITGLSNKKLTISAKKKRVVKLAEDTGTPLIISEKATSRAILALANFKKEIKKSAINPLSIYCVGTSAIRDAANKDEFIQIIKRETGLIIHPIDGLKEADYIFEGILNEGIFKDECVLIMDIGGGSVEFIVSKNQKIIWKDSFKLGAARILNTVNPDFPFSTHQKTIINHLFKTQLKSLLTAIEKFNPCILIGSSGSFDSLIAIRNKNVFLSSKHKVTNQLTVHDFQIIYDELVKKDYSSLLKTPGLLRMRAKMIVPSIMLIKFVLQKMNNPTLLVSKYSLKEGLAFSILNKK